jgi:hypothetical protein
MKKLQFLLLDAGPIIKLFSLKIWDEFLKHCDVTTARVIAEDQALYTEDGCQHINLKPYEEQHLINILEVDMVAVRQFHDKFDLLYKADIHNGEKEMLAFLCQSSEKWLVCSGDRAVFRVIGLLGKGDQGISLEEILSQIGLSIGIKWDQVTPQNKAYWPYTRSFREQWTRKGRTDFVQGQGLASP